MDENNAEANVSTKQANQPKKSKTYAILIIASSIYLALFYAVMMTTTTCPIDFVKGQFWLPYPACKSFGLNELGDTLAGAFAPLAFLWLAGAVYIQSQELREQRRELTETRDVMKAQLALSEEQVKETHASTAYFAEQTAILKRQQELREQEIADEEFDSLIQAISDIRLSQASKNFFLLETIYLSTTRRSSQIGDYSRTFPIIPPQGRSWSLQRAIQPIFGNIETHDAHLFIRELSELAPHEMSKEHPNTFNYISENTKNGAIQRLDEIVVKLISLAIIEERISPSKRHKMDEAIISRAIEGLARKKAQLEALADAKQKFMNQGWTPPDD